MAQIFLNNCYATLAQAITAIDTQIELSGMSGFPASLGAGDFFLLTLYADDSRYGSNIEVVKVTGLIGTTLTVERGYEEGTFAHAAGERAEARLTAEAIKQISEAAKPTPIGAPDWPVTLTYDGNGNLTQALYSQNNARYRQTLSYINGNLSSVLYEQSKDSGSTWTTIGTETLVYTGGTLTSTTWTEGA